MRSMSAYDQLERYAVKILLLMAPGLLRLCGKSPVRVGSEQLHPEIQMLLGLKQLKGDTQFALLPPVEGRQALRRDLAVHRWFTFKHIKTEDASCATPDGARLTLRRYIPLSNVPTPLLVYFHGGGFVVGDLDTHDEVCGFICQHAGVQVVAVDYRLAPEHNFPTAINDGLAAWEWIQTQCAHWDVDVTRIAIGGDSAGGNIAAVVTQQLVSQSRPLPALQLLIYPTVDRTVPFPSLETFGKGFLLTLDNIAQYQRHYHPNGHWSDPRYSPLKAPTFAGFSPALVVTAAFDPLADEGAAYAHALQQAGVPTEHLKISGMVHGFVNMIGISRGARDATMQICQRLKAQLTAMRST